MKLRYRMKTHRSHTFSNLSAGQWLNTSSLLVQFLECLHRYLVLFFVRKHSIGSELFFKTLNFLSLALPRVIMAVAADGLLFEVFARIHPRFKTPFYGTLIAGVMTGTLAAFFDLDQLINMMSIGTVCRTFENKFPSVIPIFI